MFSKVIIATDLSSASTEIVKKADRLKKLGTKEILLLLCVNTMEAASLAYAAKGAAVNSMLETQKGILLGYGFDADTEVVVGTFHKELNRVARHGNYSLIVIGSRGSTFSQDVLLGGVAAEMIQNTVKPTLVVRLGEIIKNTITILPAAGASFPDSVLFPTDFSVNAAFAFSYVKKLVESVTRKVTLVHVQDMVKLEKSPAEEIAAFDRIDTGRLEEMKKELLAINENAAVATSLLHGKPAVEILKEASAAESNLIVMGTQGRGLINEIVLGSVSHLVVRRAKTSVLLVPMEDR